MAGQRVNIGKQSKNILDQNAPIAGQRVNIDQQAVHIAGQGFNIARLPAYMGQQATFVARQERCIPGQGNHRRNHGMLTESAFQYSKN